MHAPYVLFVRYCYQESMDGNVYVIHFSFRMLFKSYIYEHFDKEIVLLRIKQEAFVK
jgi:hypothetical protein